MEAERELTRTKKGTEAKRNKNAERKAFVIAIYEHGKDIVVGTRFNKACDVVEKQFEDSRGKGGPWGTIPKDQKEMPTPSLDSIKRWLIEAGIRDRDFNLEERYWIKQT